MIGFKNIQVLTENVKVTFINEGRVIGFSNVISRVACCIFNDYKATILIFGHHALVSPGGIIKEKELKFFCHTTPLWINMPLPFLVSAKQPCFLLCRLCPSALMKLVWPPTRTVFLFCPCTSSYVFPPLKCISISFLNCIHAVNVQ